MRKPDSDELEAALGAATRMRDEGADPHHIAISLNYYYRRSRDLEHLLSITDRYLRFGMPEHELSEMRVLVSRLREGELTAPRSHEVDGTLPI